MPNKKYLEIRIINLQQNIINLVREKYPEMFYLTINGYRRIDKINLSNVILHKRFILN